MRIGLRLGVFRDRSVYEDLLPGDAPLIVPAHFAAYSLDGLRGFLAGLARSRQEDVVDYVIDPMTYWIELPGRYWSRGSERRQGPDLQLPLSPATRDRDAIRPSLLALLREYGLAQALYETDLAGMRERLPDRVDQCLDFQRRGTRTPRSRARTKWARILEMAADEEAMSPSALVTPYVRLASLSLGDVRDQADLNRRSLGARRADEAMWTVIALDARATISAMPAESRSLLQLDQFSKVGLWASDLDEYTADAQKLRAYRSLIRSVGRPVWVLYGSYFSLLLGSDGVALVSHGTYYTESKRMEGPVGSGPPPERYYIPTLHRFYEPTKAFRLADIEPAFACDCRECPSTDDLRAEASAASSSASKRVAWAQRLQRHFLRARSREVQAARSESPADLRDQLRDAKATYLAIEATERAGLGIAINHLDSWISALE